MSITIRNIRAYPMKGAAGIDVDTTRLGGHGLHIGKYLDHEYMAVRAEPDADGYHHFVTQRHRRHDGDPAQSLSVMARIKPQLDVSLPDDTLQLTWDGAEPLPLYHDQRTGQQLPVRIWNDYPIAVDQGEDAAEWLSDHLETPLRLVRATSPFDRRAGQGYQVNDNPISFQDGYPIHWFSAESLDELSQRAGQDIPWERFRPQFVVEGMEPGQEHTVAEGVIESRLYHQYISFTGPKPCTRCPVPRVDQDTGELNELNPLTVLSQYRGWRDRHGKRTVIFGENMLPLSTAFGTVSVGDTIKITKVRDPPLEYDPGI